MGAGVIIRDAAGDVLVSLCLKKIHVNSSVVAETEALWRALKLCSKLNIGEAMFEGDALEVVKAVNCADENWEWNGQVIADCRELLVHRPMWSITHTYREANKIAHFLANYAYNVNEEVVWIEDGPEGLFSLILQDKIVLSTFDE
ncbi:hypothetical protein F2P56_000817 [Juglans regia]|uniref:RNase H type-1 domain-containing protein n=2 Tax=Juglans regia TaxID=51240 RepID=A0A833YB69_JUGRE|nr:uncharacterized protein LOC108987991 [Juglans regia]KAF5480042.1 hypothetical protein F2P56_000817 [Juglans regia]